MFLKKQTTKKCFYLVVFVILFLFLVNNKLSLASPNIYPNQQITFCNDVTEISFSECTVLENLYNQTNGKNWSQQTGWLVTKTPCSWHGISCVDGRIIKISLSENRLSGSFPSGLVTLYNLEELYLHKNRLSGNIPTELGSLTKLKWLWLSDNQLSGTIPNTLGNLSELQNVDLSRNSLNGTIPTSFGNLSKLQSLGVGNNQLTGTIPTELGRLSELIGLYLQSNQLTGDIPTTLSNLKNLQYLWLSNNQLSGSLPVDLIGLEKLETFYFSGTDICEPRSQAIQDWLAGIDDLQRTNSLCAVATSTPTITLTPANTYTPTATSVAQVKPTTPIDEDYLVYLPTLLKQPPPPTPTPTYTPEFTPTPIPTNTPSIDPNAIQVATSGNDTTDCGPTESPCRTIQYAVDKASSGGSVFVHAGTYQSSNNPVIEIKRKSLTIRGAGVGKTFIDGDNVRRCVYVVFSEKFRMENLTIQNCFADSDPSGDRNVFGAGMFTDRSEFTLNNMAFKNNRVVGRNSNGKAGAGSGGGLAIRTANEGASLTNITFEGNQAEGGQGETGGYGLGGGLYTYRAVVYGKNLTFTNNKAMGGQSTGSGNNGGRADALGGGASFQSGSSITLEYVRATKNSAIGGNTKNSGNKAGGGYGGAIFSEGELDQPTSVSLKDADIRNNKAVGGDATNGGNGYGGGLQFDKSKITLNRVYVVDNAALSGNSSGGKTGPGNGGGILLQNVKGGGMSVTIQNTVIARNVATGREGGGGAMWIQGVSDAKIEHTTIVDNKLNDEVTTRGYAIHVNNYGGNTPSSKVTMKNSIITNHTDNGRAEALYIASNNLITLKRTLWANNDKKYRNSVSNLVQNNNPVSPEPNSVGFIDNNYHISQSSAARDQAEHSNVSTDIDNEPRNDGSPDVGSDEYSE